MMAVRVNLLRPEELRYQGAVSRDFAVRAVGWGGLALVLLLSLLWTVRQRSLRRELALLQESWSTLEPRYERVRLMQEDLNKVQTIRDELTAWHASRVEWNVLLDELQRIVPAQVQLTKLSVRSELGVLADPPDARPGVKTPPRPARKFNLRIDGKTSGDLADEVVVKFASTLRGAEAYKTVLESVKLQGLQRAVADKGRESERMFGIEGVSFPRAM